jgi:hypothetical protein
LDKHARAQVLQLQCALSKDHALRIYAILLGDDFPERLKAARRSILQDNIAELSQG